MLIELTIDNVAVIEHASASFEKGLCILSGETGAGKSLLIDSLNMVLGKRTARDIIRGGERSAAVRAVFYAPHTTALLKEMLLEAEEDGTLVLSRTIDAGGRNICRVNSSTVTLSQLREIGDSLVIIHGQHDNQKLLCPSEHLGVLDAYAKNGEAAAAYTLCYDEYRTAQKELAALREQGERRAEREAYLKEALGTLHALKLKDGEEEELRTRLAVLANAESMAEVLSEADGALNGESGAKALLYGALSALKTAAAIDASLKETCEGVADAYYRVEDAALTVADKIAADDYSAFEMDTLQSRLDAIEKVKKKYGENLPLITEEMERESDEISDFDDILEKKVSHCGALLDKAKAAAKILTKTRERAAKELCDMVSATLETLDMPKVRLSYSFTPCALSRTGAETGEMLISTSPAEEPKPLARIASGGELSRIMLAIRSAFARSGGSATLLFDEIDSGVSGRAAARIADLLSKLSLSRQIICVTHLAQIAAAADCHMLVEKDTTSDVFRASVTRLDDFARVREVARIIGGETLSDATFEAAKDMIAERTRAKNDKKCD